MNNYSTIVLNPMVDPQWRVSFDSILNFLLLFKRQSVVHLRNVAFFSSFQVVQKNFKSGVHPSASGDRVR